MTVMLGRRFHRKIPNQALAGDIIFTKISSLKDETRFELISFYILCPVRDIPRETRLTMTGGEIILNVLPKIEEIPKIIDQKVKENEDNE